MTQQEFIERYSYDPSTDALGSGGFGSVYKAYDNEEDSFVALKISNVDPKYPELRLRNEVSKAHDLRHKNVARYEACHTFRTLSGEMDVAIMHYYEHGSLNSFISSGELSYEVRCDILTQLLEGIAYLHKNGIIHRDLKPQNVLMVHHAGKYIPKITDFGISKQLAEGESSMVSNSLLGGTRSYASPEQLRERGIRKNTDLWSFGVIAYYMLAGELPFTTGDASSSSEEGYIEQMRRILAGALPESINRVPEPWQSVIRGCLVVDNNQRLQHAEDCLAMLKSSEPSIIVIADDTTDVDSINLDNKAYNTSKGSDSKNNNSRYSQQPLPKNKPNKRKRLWWVWVIIAVVTVATATAILVDGDNKSANSKNTNEVSTIIQTNQINQDSLNRAQAYQDSINRMEHDTILKDSISNAEKRITEEKASEKRITEEKAAQKRAAEEEARIMEEIKDDIQQDDEIWYTSSDGQVINPKNPDAFGAKLVYNKYISERGVIKFDKYITKIGNNAFEGCNRLVRIYPPKFVIEYGANAFQNCSSLKNFDIHNGVTKIGASAFCGCSLIKFVDIPVSVQSIGEGAFSSCSQLKTIYCDNTTPPSGAKNMFGETNSNLEIIVPDPREYVSEPFWATYKDIIRGWTYREYFLREERKNKDARIKRIEQELQSYSELISKEAESSAPTFGLR